VKLLKSILGLFRPLTFAPEGNWLLVLIERGCEDNVDLGKEPLKLLKRVALGKPNIVFPQ
jgi:hypothetical protein